MSQDTFACNGLPGNAILSRLLSDEASRFTRHFRTVELGAQQTLYAPGDEVTHAYFPVGCVITTVTTMNDGATVETSMVGREGVAGVAAVTTSGLRVRDWTRVLLAGEALRVEASLLREVFQEGREWQTPLLRYYSTLIGQVSRRAVCNTRHRLNERLGTWLLMLFDRVGRDEIMLTQEIAARQLGVRRAGVNECMGQLQRANIVQHSRGHIRLVNREALEGAACLCYPEFREDARWHESAFGRDGSNSHGDGLRRDGTMFQSSPRMQTHLN
ncbi:MAG TPA: Crp/Fnr family transcriptional regulator [Pyrinomonadaceae bacterium]|nr:Crp/Fnr family transcriptional regulator [Pyrinomonadaceae bacterium]